MEYSSNLNTQGGLLNRNRHYNANRSDWCERGNAVNSAYSWRRPVDDNSSYNYRAEPRNDRQIAVNSSWRDRNNVNERIPRKDEEIKDGSPDWQVAGSSRRANSTMGNWRNQDNRNSGEHYHNWHKNNESTNTRARSPGFVPKKRSDRISRERSPVHEKRNDKKERHDRKSRSKF